MKRLLLSTILAAIVAAPIPFLHAQPQPAPQPVPRDEPSARVKDFLAYKEVVAKTAAMVDDAQAQQLAHKHSLNVLNLTWEDTGREKNSALGPNISDMTIQVQQMDPRNEKFSLTLMPVIRYPNFEDKSADLAIDKFFILVGNQSGEALKKITLRQYLESFRDYLSQPKSWKGNGRSLLAPRDTHVLVSAQACFLPIPKEGKAEFNPVLFNYQSYKDNPAVLAIVCTREGASATVIDNERDAFQAGATWGQRLFFNAKGQRAPLTGQRVSDFNKPATAQPKPGETPEQPKAEAAKESGLNLVLLIQVPLKQKNPRPNLEGAPTFGGAQEDGPDSPKQARKSDVEDAAIGHGKVEGPFTEVADLEIERDPRFPIRVTVQFYKATSNGVVSEDDLKQIAEQIKKVYAQADYVGSLVTEGDTGRPTEHSGASTQRQ